MELKVLFLFLWFCSAPVHSSVIKRLHWYYPYPRPWESAQQDCKQSHSGDLAAVVTDTDLRDMNLDMYYAWIGLRKMNGNWEWAVSTEHYNKLPAQRKAMLLTVEDEDPGEECGLAIYAQKNAFAENCDEKYFVICEDTDNEYFIPKTMSWVDGLNFCEREGKLYMDTGKSTLGFGGSPVYQHQDFPVWIGVSHKDPAVNPAPGSGLCLTISSQDLTVSSKNCSESYPYICYKNNLVLLKEELSWEDAIKTCRSKYIDLLSVEENELDYVQSYAQGATTSKVWLGLRFLAGSWFWSNNAPVSLSSLPSCPEFHLGCGALVISTNSTSGPRIELIDCSEKLNVFCYGSGS